MSIFNFCADACVLQVPFRVAIQRAIFFFEQDELHMIRQDGLICHIACQLLLDDI